MGVVFVMGVPCLDRALPTTREGASRLGLVTLRAMAATLTRSVQSPPFTGDCNVEVPEIRKAR